MQIGLYQLINDTGAVLELGLLVPQTSRPSSASVPSQYYRKRGSKHVRAVTDGIVEASAAAWAWHGAVQGAVPEDYLNELLRFLPRAVKVKRKRDDAWVPLSGGGALMATQLASGRYDVSFSLRATYLGWLRENTFPLGSGRLGAGQLPRVGESVEVF